MSQLGKEIDIASKEAGISEEDGLDLIDEYMNLLETNVKYIRAESENAINEQRLDIIANHEKAGHIIVNLFETSWAEYSRKEFPELYPIDAKEEILN